jgi:hypothetical protein
MPEQGKTPLQSCSFELTNYAGFRPINIPFYRTGFSVTGFSWPGRIPRRGLIRPYPTGDAAGRSENCLRVRDPSIHNPTERFQMRLLSEIPAAPDD